MTEEKTMLGHMVETKEAIIILQEDGASRFMFRGMDYVYERVKDSTEGMSITLDKESTDAIKRLFRRADGR